MTQFKLFADYFPRSFCQVSTSSIIILSISNENVLKILKGKIYFLLKNSIELVGCLITRNKEMCNGHKSYFSNP